MTIDKELFAAVASNDINKVEFLVEKKVNLNISDEKGKTPLMLACSNGYKDIVQILVNGKADLNLYNKLGTTALMYAVEKGYKEIVEFLLEKGVDVNQAFVKNFTALIYASKHNHIEIAEILIKAGADVNKYSNKGLSALSYASQNNNIDMVRLLCINKAKIDIVDKGGITPLHIASILGHKEILQFLINSQANINMVDCMKWSALDHVIARNVDGNIEENMIEIAKILLINGCSFNGTTIKLAKKNNLLKKYIDSALISDSFFKTKSPYNTSNISDSFKNLDSDILIARYMKNINNVSNYFNWDNAQLDELLNVVPNIPEQQKKEISTKLRSKLWSIREEFDLSVSSIMAQVYDIKPFSLLEFIKLRYENSEEDLTYIPTGIVEILKFYSEISDLDYNEIITLLEKPTLTPEEISSLKMSIVNADIQILENNLEEIINYAFMFNYFDNIENILKLEIPTELKNVLNQAYENKCQELYEELIKEKNIENWLDMSLPTSIITKLETEFSEYNKEAYEYKCQKLYEELMQEPNIEAWLDMSLPIRVMTKLEIAFPEFHKKLEEKRQNNSNSEPANQLDDLSRLEENNIKVELTGEE